MQRSCKRNSAAWTRCCEPLCRDTGEAMHQNLADRFEKAAFFDPLAVRRDELKGLHGNTHIPQVIARPPPCTKMTATTRYRDIATFSTGRSRRSRYCDGRHNQRRVAGARLPASSRGLSKHRTRSAAPLQHAEAGAPPLHVVGDPRVIDYYQRTLFNRRLGTTEPGRRR